MKLYLKGHDYKYAVEQMLFTLFSGEKPIYSDEEPEEGEPWIKISLSKGAVFSTAKTELFYSDTLHTFSSRVKTAGLPDGVELDRAHTKAIKLSFYRAGTEALGKEPPWGALTGVRPVKLPTKAMLAGETPAQAEATLRDTYHVTPSRVKLAMDCARASIKAKKSLGENEVSLYVGIPFCPTRCAYCSFVSADVGRTLKLVEPYLAALCQEIAAAGAILKRENLFVRTVYIGGGTPTTLSAEQLTALMHEIAKHIDLSHCSEYTVEAGRPDTITAEKLTAIKNGGADRVSVNPQTMHDHVLAAMGRAHSAADILVAYELVRQSGIPCVNMDLIAGLPADSVEGFRSSLDQVLAMGAENVTVHTLALKKGSRLLAQNTSVSERGECRGASRDSLAAGDKLKYLGAPEGLPSGEDVADMLDYAWARLREEGYEPYYLYRQKYMSGSFENVGWTKPGYENLYNIAMMEELHTVLALGGGGVTKLVDTERGKIERMADPKYPYEYISGIEKIAAEKEKLAEFYSNMRRT